MATNPATINTNPFASLSRSLNDSRLSGGAVIKNLNDRIALDRRREQFRSQSAQPSTQSATPGSSPAQAPALTLVKPDQSVPADAPKQNPFSNLSRGKPGAQRLTSMDAPRNPAPAVPAPATSSMFSRAPAAFSDSATPAQVKTESAPPSKKGGMFSVAVEEGFDVNDIAFLDDIAPAKAPKKSVVYTEEMQRVINCNDPLIVVDAFAGCGKTTTAVGYADARPNERILYMCLNKANAEEAKGRFKSNVTCATTHSVAWRAMKPNKDRITNRWKPALIMDQLRLNSPREAMITERILAEFFNSADTQISEKHTTQVAYERDLTGTEITNGMAFATLAWKRMNDPKDKLQMPHDAYLKMFALKAPSLPYDTIIFDEAQDANPVTLQIINGQKNTRILCIGDRHQSIYQFRGSVNAMEKLSVGATHLHLTQTWRFGDKIADLANLILGEFKDEKVKITGMGKDAPWDNTKVTTLSRTNAELFRIAAPVRGEGIHWVGGVENYRLDLVMDAYHLFIRERSLIKDDLMRRKFASWDEYVRYADDANDGEAKVLTKVVEEFEDGIPELVEDIRKNAVLDSDDATMTLTTAHRSKGLDWDFVRISDDFKVLEEAENIAANHPEADMPIQDINLLYVAITRAKKAVELNGETLTWIENLPKHRADREAAATRLMSLLQGQREEMQRAR